MPPSSPTPPGELSELEGGVLGIVAYTPGATAHGVRETFRRSRSSHWSGSAGAIYPLIKKLHERGLLAAEESPRGSRTRRSYTITKEGTQALRRWLAPPLAPWVASVTFDPLRTRMPFLGTLPPAQQIAFLEHAERLLEDELVEARRERDAFRGEDDFWLRATSEGCLATLRARLRWVRKTKEDLQGG